MFVRDGFMRVVPVGSVNLSQCYLFRKRLLQLPHPQSIVSLQTVVGDGVIRRQEDGWRAFAQIVVGVERILNKFLSDFFIEREDERMPSRKVPNHLFFGHVLWVGSP